MKKRKDRSTEISITFAMIALVAAILIVYFDTAYKLKLLDERIENIEMSGPQTDDMVRFAAGGCRLRVTVSRLKAHLLRASSLNTPAIFS
jgi:hypothetical protein